MGNGLKRHQVYYRKNKAKATAATKEWQKKNPEALKAASKRYYQKHKDKLREKHREWCRKNPEKKKALALKSRIKNRDKINEKARKYNRAKRSTPEGKIAGAARLAVKRAIRGGAIIDKRTMETTGCTPPVLRAHLEARFKPGMTWKNHGVNGWHIDHIIPLCSFDLNDPEQAAIALHYTNLQPLWARDNLKKARSIRAAA